MFKIKIDRNEVLESPLVYTVLTRRDGSKVYEIHKNRINTKTGIVTADELIDIMIQAEAQFQK